MLCDLCEPIELWFGADPTRKPVKDLTTVQLTTKTRDRLYKLKFRKTYDEFLQELCDLYEGGASDARKRTL